MKYVFPEVRNGRVPVREKTIFWRFEASESVFQLPAKRPAYRSRNDHFPTFRQMKNFLPVIRNGRVPVREVTIFGRFGARKSVFQPPAKRPAYISRNDHFFWRFGTWKIIFPKYEMSGFPFAKWPFLDVSEPEKANSSLRRNGRLTVREMTIFNDVSAPEKFPPEIRNGRVPVREVTIFGRFGAWENIFWPPEKRTAYRPRNYHFFRRFGTWNIFHPKYETAGFPFAKWPFLDV